MSTAPAGYSGTPLVRKLGIKPGHRVLLVDAPDGFAQHTLGALPDGAALGDHAIADVIVAFCTARADVERCVPELRDRMDAAAGLWIAWPKKASKVATDVTEDVVREIALENRLVDNKVCAIDATWSGLRLVIRLADRPA
jgi:translation elongation factor EF-4